MLIVRKFIRNFIRKFTKHSSESSIYTLLILQLFAVSAAASYILMCSALNTHDCTKSTVLVLVSVCVNVVMPTIVGICYTASVYCYSVELALSCYEEQHNEAYYARTRQSRAALSYTVK
jgi:hypothetical protein